MRLFDQLPTASPATPQTKRQQQQNQNKTNPRCSYLTSSSGCDLASNSAVANFVTQEQLTEATTGFVSADEFDDYNTAVSAMISMSVATDGKCTATITSQSDEENHPVLAGCNTESLVGLCPDPYVASQVMCGAGEGTQTAFRVAIPGQWLFSAYCTQLTPWTPGTTRTYSMYFTCSRTGALSTSAAKAASAAQQDATFQALGIKFAKP